MKRDPTPNLERLADAVADRVMVRLVPFFLGMLDGAEMDAPEAREALRRLLTPPPRPPDAQA